MRPAVLFDHVSKRFRRGERHDTVRDMVVGSLRQAFRRGSGRVQEDLAADEFWALRDVSFAVHPGKALGIIGPNGAGKSTTLKLLTKILRPTHGHCSVSGRVGALIEIASGFHPDLTGRENTFLQGAIMGMSRPEIAAKLDAIIDFAGVADFIDTPVKRYSSGMNARLGFAIAAHLDPDVLIIDEVLGVGDMAFQQRCIDRMKAFKGKGVTIVFVSHNLQAVSDLCDEALHLNHSLQDVGPTAQVIGEYVRKGAAATATAAQAAAIITDVTLMHEGRALEGAVSPGSELQLRVTYGFADAPDDLTFGVVLYRSTDGLRVYDANFTPAEISAQGAMAQSKDGSRSLTVEYDLRAHLTRGQYHFECHVFHNPSQTFLARVAPAAHLSVFELRTWAGIADLAVQPHAPTRVPSTGNL
jgi:lipopolysaccharide transport system ATP-binding protein